MSAEVVGISILFEKWKEVHVRTVTHSRNKSFSEKEEYMAERKYSHFGRAIKYEKNLNQFTDLA